MHGNNKEFSEICQVYYNVIRGCVYASMSTKICHRVRLVGGIGNIF